ncbi:MAG: hypothetical protein BGO29_01250 [Bacteroidales bacterium 36-12]|nr:MAG: hypothetical protein BGO29_01250 [Bacteroidales bacterium 36-12]
MKTRSYFFIFCFLSFIGCQKTTRLQSDFNAVVIEVNPADAAQDVNLSNIFSTIDYVELETEDEYLIGEVSQMLVYNDRYYILDENITQSIFCFDIEGKFIFKIDAIGNGPDEYLNPASIAINDTEQKLLIYCDKSSRVLSYDLDGKYLSTSRIGFIATRMAFLKDNHYAFFCDYNTSNVQYHENHSLPNLIITDKNFKVAKTNLFFPETVNFSAISMLPKNFDNAEELSLLVPYNDTIYHITPDELIRAFYMDFGKYKKDKACISSLFDATLDHEDINTIMTNKCNMVIKTESEDALFFIYLCGYKCYYAFYKKQDKILYQTYIDFTNEVNKIDYPFKNDIDGSPFTTPFYAYKDKFYGVVTPDKLQQYSTKILQDENLISKEKITPILNSTSPYNNPVIVVYTLN